MNYCIITTYNRPNQVQSLTERISKIFDGDILVFDDGSDIIPQITGTLIRYPYNHGKLKYWQLVTEIFEYLKEKDFKYFWMLPDDIEISENIFSESIRIWEGIKDERKICLSVGHNHNRHLEPCWTYFKPIKMGEVVLTNWNDLCFMAEKNFLSALDYRIERPFPEYDFRSSGVGRHISRKLYSLNYNLYHVDKSLVEFPANETVMHREKVKI